MLRSFLVISVLALSSASVQAENIGVDPFPPLEATQGVIDVGYADFAQIPDADNGEAPRLMHMVVERGTQRLFVSTMRGVLYGMTPAGKDVTAYIDINDPRWAFPVQPNFPERGLQSFAFHPQFAQRGKPGYGKFYTWADTSNMTPKADFVSGGTQHSHDTVLLEWTAKDAKSATYDGEAPKELIRVAQPFINHNGGEIAFDPLARGADALLLYVGVADGGAGGDPMHNAPKLSSLFGKILRIDPLGHDSANGRYGIPASNPFVGQADALGEIWAYGLRNPQRFNWDKKNGRMLVADIGQNQVEEISEVTRGGNLGWSKWEGNYRYVEGKIDLDNLHAEPGLIWPIVEYDHKDPLLQGMVAITGVIVNRSGYIKPLKDKIIFGDIGSGEIFYVHADKPATGGAGEIRRVLLIDEGPPKTFLQVINDGLTRAGKKTAARVDLRFGTGFKDEIFIMNKHDGIIRKLVPAKK